MEESPGFVFEGEFRVAPDGSAKVEGSIRTVAGLAWMLKEQLRDVPEQNRTFIVRQQMGQLIPGLSVDEFSMPGLDADGERPSLVGKGTISRFPRSGGTGLDHAPALSPPRADRPVRR